MIPKHHFKPGEDIDTPNLALELEPGDIVEISQEEWRILARDNGHIALEFLGVDHGARKIFSFGFFVGPTCQPKFKRHSEFNRR